MRRGVGGGSNIITGLAVSLPAWLPISWLHECSELLVEPFPVAPEMCNVCTQIPI